MCNGVKALHLPPPSADGAREGEVCAIELEYGSLSFVRLSAQVGSTLRELRGRDHSSPPADGSIGDLDLERGNLLGMIGASVN